MIDVESGELERQLWDELSSLLADAMPEGVSEAEAEGLDAIVFAVMGYNPRDSRSL